MTPQQQALTDRIAAFLEAEPRVEAAWLAGSLGRGEGDAFSDVDVLVLVADGAASGVSTDLAHGLAAIANPVLVNSLFGGRVLNVVTDAWERFDLSIAEGKELAFHDAAALAPLFNRSGRTPPVQPPADYRAAPGAVLKLVEEFLRVLGLAVVGLGRREYAIGLSGVELLRRMTMDLMLEANRVPPARRGGALHRNPLLTDAQRVALESAPPLSATRESVLEGQLYLAGVFLPLARQLGGEIGMVWPAALEAATRDSLRRHLDFELP